MTAPTHAALDVDALRRARAAACLGRTIHYFDSVDSTSTVAHRLATEGAAEGTVVIAESQTKGRGRLGRAWVSPPFRNLYMSIVLRPSIAAALAPQIALVAGLAVVEAVDLWTPQAAIKWPNDVVLDGRKLAGILAEMDAHEERVRFVILGIGVNLNGTMEELPPELRDKAVTLCTVAGEPIDRVRFADRLLARLEDRYALFLRQGFAAVRPVWEGRSCLTGRQVRIDGGGQRVDGVVIGVAPDGALLLRDAAGAAKRVVVGDVTIVNGYDATDRAPREKLTAER